MQEMQGKRVGSLGQEDPLEKEMATHSSIIAGEVPRTQESGGLKSTDLQSGSWFSNETREMYHEFSIPIMIILYIFQGNIYKQGSDNFFYMGQS